MESKTALIGMSGGVDSSVAAYLMLQQGFRCVGVTLRLYDNAMHGQDNTRTCCSLDDVEDARSVARRLNIPHYVFNFKDEFEAKVIRPFVDSYEAGLTPNPCIECNRHLKFRKLLQRAKELGYEYVVSGHYAQVRQDPASGRTLLYKAVDQSKDQTYFLACLDQEQLSHIQFPLGGLTKQEVRQIAQEQGFINARKHDSQDICFVPEGDYVAFLERYTGKPYAPGNYLDRDGRVVGTHRGAVAYTLGQRKGLGVALGEPMYVCGKDMTANTVTLGRNEDLFSGSLLAGELNFIPFPALLSPMTVEAKIRHSQHGQTASITPLEDGTVRVDFAQPQRAVTPGQAVVFYDGDLVIGSGTILKSIP